MVNLSGISFDNRMTEDTGGGVVDVMLKPEIIDPQGKAVHGALPRLGFAGVRAVRQGKRFEPDLEGDLTADRLADINRVAEMRLSNPVSETYTGRVAVSGGSAS